MTTQLDRIENMLKRLCLQIPGALDDTDPELTQALEDSIYTYTNVIVDSEA